MAFAAAIVGWVWHAGRLSNKLYETERRLDEHLEYAAAAAAANEESHASMMRRIDEVRADVSYIRGKLDGRKFNGTSE